MMTTMDLPKKLRAEAHDENGYGHPLTALLLSAADEIDQRWRGIKDAPRDGTPILARNSRHPSHAPVVVRWWSHSDDVPHCDAATADGSALYFKWELLRLLDADSCLVTRDNGTEA